MNEQADPHLAAVFLNTITLRQYGVHASAEEHRNSNFDGDTSTGESYIIIRSIGSIAYCVTFPEICFHAQK
jgi:hypothetical protein